MITLAREQPIVHEEMDLRDLLLEAFYKGQQVREKNCVLRRRSSMFAGTPLRGAVRG